MIQSLHLHYVITYLFTTFHGFNHDFPGAKDKQLLLYAAIYWSFCQYLMCSIENVVQSRSELHDGIYTNMFGDKHTARAADDL